MKINLITLISPLHSKNKEIKNFNNSFIFEINNYLMNEDIELVENAKEEGVLDAVFIASGGAEAKFLKIKDTLSRPFILFSSGSNNSLAASLEIKTYCAQNDVSDCFLTGNAEDVAESIKHVANVFYTREKMRDTNLGVIGKPSDWLIGSKVDKKDAKDVYGVNIIDIDYKEFTALIDAHELPSSHPRYKELVKKYKDKDTLNMALYIYSAIKKLVIKYNLKGVTIRCFDLLNKYKNTSCLALAMLNEEGIVAACEGDVPALITMYILQTLTGRPSFMCNPSSINLQSLELTLAHCTVPFNMINKYELPTHFESDLGIGIKGTLNEGKITIFKLSSDIKGDNDLIIPATIKENLSLKGLCRTQILVGIGEMEMFEIVKQNCGNHLIVCYGNIVNDLFALVNLFKGKGI